MALQLWETLKESIFAYTGLSPAAFFTAVAVGLALYYMFANWLSPSEVYEIERDSRETEEPSEPLPPPVQVGEITVEELKQYDGSDPKKPLLMAIKGQIYDISQSRTFYGPGGPYALFAGKDPSRALAKLSFEDKDLNGDLTGLGVFELEALQDWEYKFMSKYVKVGTVKTTVPVTEGIAVADQSTEAAEPTPDANGDVLEPEEELKKEPVVADEKKD